MKIQVINILSLCPSVGSNFSKMNFYCHCYFSCSKIHVKLTIVVMFAGVVSVIEHIHIVVQPSSPSSSRTLSPQFKLCVHYIRNPYSLLLLLLLAAILL
jgi:hypothetical protein